mmetsp:Transcript_23859/g.47335  ORF Transcript_23859/g.47335 Transcript_23859/m.47335 type:complete len:103 (-) Transcript_23859:7-315(-)
MGQRSNDAAVKDVQTMSRMEESALDMERKSKRSNDAAMMDALIESYGEECAGGTGHIAILMKNLQHLTYPVNQYLMKRLQLFPTRAPPQLRVFKMKVAFLLA